MHYEPLVQVWTLGIQIKRKECRTASQDRFHLNTPNIHRNGRVTTKGLRLSQHQQQQKLKMLSLNFNYRLIFLHYYTERY
jgi:hypothetical protein